MEINTYEAKHYAIKGLVTREEKTEMRLGIPYMLLYSVFKPRLSAITGRERYMKIWTLRLDVATGYFDIVRSVRVDRPTIPTVLIGLAQQSIRVQPGRPPRGFEESGIPFDANALLSDTAIQALIARPEGVSGW